MKPRVLLVPAPQRPGASVPSGVDRYLSILSQALSDKVDYLFLDDPATEVAANVERGTRNAEKGGKTIAESEGLSRPVIHVSSFPGLRSFLSAFPLRLMAGYVRDTIRLARIMRPYRDKVDVIHVNRVGCEIQTIAAKLAGFRKVLTTIHNLPGEDVAAGHWFRRLVERLSFACGDLHIAVSDATYEAWDKQIGLAQDHTIRIYNGMEPPDYSRFDRHAYRRQFCEDPDNTVLIGIIARLHPMKGHAVLLEALARLLHRQKSDLLSQSAGSTCNVLRSTFRAQRLLLLIAGEGPEKVNIEEKITGLEIGDCVRLLGHRNDALELVKALNILVQPSVTLETLSYSVVEAMFASIPVITSDVGGAKELMTSSDSGRVVGKGNVAALVDALEYYLLHPEIAVTDGEKGRLFAEHNLTAKGMAGATLAAYTSLIRKGVVE